MEAGAACWHRRDEYRMLIPGLLQWLFSQDGWAEQFEKSVAEIIEGLRDKCIRSIQRYTCGQQLGAKCLWF